MPILAWFSHLMLNFLLYLYKKMGLNGIDCYALNYNTCRELMSFSLIIHHTINDNTEVSSMTWEDAMAFVGAPVEELEAA